MKFVLASHNKGKLAELQEILGELGVEVVLQSDRGTGLGAGRNWHHLCRECPTEGASRHGGQRPACHRRRLRSVRGRPPAAAPGVYSARYGGPGHGRQPDGYQPAAAEPCGAQIAPYLPLRIAASPAASPTGIMLDARGHVQRYRRLCAHGGRGLRLSTRCSSCRQLKKTFAQLTAEEKNAISHRGNALRDFAGQN